MLIRGTKEGNFCGKEQLRDLSGGWVWLKAVPCSFLQRSEQYIQWHKRTEDFFESDATANLRKLIAQDVRRNIDAAKRGMAERILFAVVMTEHMDYHQGMDYLLVGLMNGMALREEQVFALFVFSE
jgi:hypothetical protein